MAWNLTEDEKILVTVAAGIVSPVVSPDRAILQAKAVIEHVLALRGFPQKAPAKQTVSASTKRAS